MHISRESQTSRPGFIRGWVTKQSAAPHQVKRDEGVWEEH